MVKVLGMVNATPDYTEQPYVINGYTELMKKVFGYEHGVWISCMTRPELFSCCIHLYQLPAESSLLSAAVSRHRGTQRSRLWLAPWRNVCRDRGHFQAQAQRSRGGQAVSVDTPASNERVAKLCRRRCIHTPQPSSRNLNGPTQMMCYELYHR